MNYLMIGLAGFGLFLVFFMLWLSDRNDDIKANVAFFSLFVGGCSMFAWFLKLIGG